MSDSSALFSCPNGEDVAWAEALFNVTMPFAASVGYRKLVIQGRALKPFTRGSGSLNAVDFVRR